MHRHAPSQDPEIGALDAAARRFETPCGTGRMVWRRWGEGRPLVLLHGGSGSWLHWLKTIPALAPRFSVWAPDMPGFGESDVPPEPHDIDRYVSVLREGLEQLIPEARIELAGFSFGAALAARLARALEGRFGDLVLSGANFCETGSVAPLRLVSLKRHNAEHERLRALKHNIKVMMIAHDRNIDPLALRLYGIDTARRRLPRVPYAGFATLRADLPGVRVQGRLAAICGADDQVIGNGAQRQREALRGLRPDAEYHAIEGAGHWVMYEAAERYNDALLGVLAA